MDQTGTQLGYYRLYEKIGGGGFATVYVARDTRTNQVVAVKVLHPQYGEDKNFIARFLREAEVLKSLPEDPHIVHLKEVGQQGSIYFLVMEYLEGQDLSHMILERGRLPVREALTIAYQIAQALDVAHRNGLVHRDIKPSNVKITPQGIAKVMDFGIARAAEQTRLTQAGTLMGTPDYMAPEIWENEKADIRSDIYALGMILYEMLTGQTPFHSDSPAAVMHGHLMRQPRSVHSVRPEVPASVNALIAKMLAKRPEDRYQTPADVLEALRKELSVESPTIQVDKTVPAKPVQRKLAFSSVPVIGVAALIGLCLLSAVIFVSLVLPGVLSNPTQIASGRGTVTAAVTLTPSPGETVLVIVIPTFTVTPGNTATPTATATTTATQTSSPAATSTRLPTDTPTPARPSVIYPAVTLREPKNGQTVRGNSITFEWNEVESPLQPGYLYSVFFKRQEGAGWAERCTQERNRCVLSFERGLGYGAYTWTVFIVDEKGKEVSQKGEERDFIWEPARPGSSGYGGVIVLPPELSGESPIKSTSPGKPTASDSAVTALSMLAAGALLALLAIGEWRIIATRLRALLNLSYARLASIFSFLF